MIWSKRERSGLPALKLLFGLLLLVLLAACGEDEPALTKPTTALEPVMTQVIFPRKKGGGIKPQAESDVQTGPG